MTHQRVENRPGYSSIAVHFLTRGIVEEISTIFAAFIMHACQKIKNQKRLTKRILTMGPNKPPQQPYRGRNPFEGIVGGT
jgi:hypothetical protein